MRLTKCSLLHLLTASVDTAPLRYRPGSLKITESQACWISLIAHCNAYISFCFSIWFYPRMNCWTEIWWKQECLERWKCVQTQQDTATLCSRQHASGHPRGCVNAAPLPAPLFSVTINVYMLTWTCVLICSPCVESAHMVLTLRGNRLGQPDCLYISKCSNPCCCMRAQRKSLSRLV